MAPPVHAVPGGLGGAFGRTHRAVSHDFDHFTAEQRAADGFDDVGQVPLIDKLPGCFRSNVAGNENHAPLVLGESLLQLQVKILAVHSGHPHVAKDSVKAAMQQPGQRIGPGGTDLDLVSIRL